MTQIATKYTRFKDAPWFPKEDTEVIVGGAGGIGSWLVLLLTRAGIITTVYDFDLYEEHNMGGQLCKATDIGKSKVWSLEETLTLFCGPHTTYMQNEAFTNDTMVHKYMFSAFDNIEARRTMFKKWSFTYRNDPTAIFIDGRLTMEQLQIFCVKGGDTENILKYEVEYLFDDKDVPELACTMKQTSHTAAMIASHMTAFFTNHLANVQTGDDARVLPFFWEYFVPIDYLNN